MSQLNERELREAVLKDIGSMGLQAVVDKTGLGLDELSKWAFSGEVLVGANLYKVQERMDGGLAMPQPVQLPQPIEVNQAPQQQITMPKSVDAPTQTMPGRPNAVEVKAEGQQVVEVEQPVALEAPVKEPQEKKETPGLFTQKPVTSGSIQDDSANVCLLFPIHDSVSPETFATVLRFVRGRSKIAAEWRAGDSEIQRSRNHLTKRFLETSCEWSIWIDDDMLLPCGSESLYRVFAGGYDNIKKQVNPKHWSSKIPGKYLEFDPVSRLTTHGKTIVSACYWDRWGKNTLTAGYSQGIQGRPPVDAIHPVDYCGFGCIAIHRTVFEDIAKKFPEVMNPDAMGNECGFFTEFMRPDGSMRGEDESFCWRAREAGHNTYLDLAMICGHKGYAVYGLPEA